MTALGTFGGREEVGQKHYIVFGISSIFSLAVDGRWQRSMTGLSKVLARDQLFMKCEDLTKGLANKFELQQVFDTTLSENLDLDFDGQEIPGRGSWYYVGFLDTEPGQQLCCHIQS
jgi:hypothetical protein